MNWSLLPVFALFVGFTTSQYVQQQQQRAGVAQQQQVQQSVQAAQPDAIDQIPAWYQMAKPVASRVQQLPQASPSYYERHEPTYEQRREQPTYERPGIQTNQYANYPSYQNRQPYENLNALASGASLSNLQANRRFPSSANSASVSGGAGGSDMPYDSALKRYHKLLLKRRQWTTKIGRILASTTPMTTAASTTTSPTPITKKMPKSLKSIYSTINLRTTTTEVPSTISRVTAKTRGTFKPHGTRKGWRMWKKVTPKYAGKLNTTTTEARSTSTISPTEPNTFAPSTDSSITVGASSTSIPLIPELPLIEEEEEVTGATTEQPTSTTTTEATTATTPTTATETTTRTTTMAPTTTSTSTSTSEEGKVPSSLRPISVGHKWKPLRFKKPEPPVDEIDNTVSSNKTISPRPTGLRLLEYLLPNTELLAAIKDVVAKFKASLDEAGIDQDVRQMGNQLKNTWQQLRTGPMNEQIGRILEKAVADAADQKQQQQIQKVQQQLASSRLSI